MNKLINRSILIAVAMLTCLTAGAQVFKSHNMSMLSRWDDDSLTALGLQSYNDVWGWYDSAKKREYAIVGTADSTYFFDVTDPRKPVKCAAEAGRMESSIWRDYDTYLHYCYAVQDFGLGSLQIFDMQYLPDSVEKVYDSDSLVLRSHTIFRAGDKLYCNSTTTRNGTRRAITILSLANPEKPVIAGIVTPPIFGGSAAFNVCHDTHVNNDTAYCSGESSGLFIYDVSNPANPKFISSFSDYPEKGYNHSSWLTEDKKHLFFTDETAGLGIKSIDVSDLNDIELKKVFRSNTGAIAHNPYIKGNYLYVSYYEDGAYIFDISDPVNPKVTAYFDTHYQNMEGQYRGFYGCWSVYPFLPSGNLLALDQTNGLFVLRPDAINSANELAINNFNVYPNPVNTDKITISLVNTNEDEVTISITNTLGATVYSTEQQVDNGLNNIEVNLPAGLKQGIYFVTITGRISNICKKILKP